MNGNRHENMCSKNLTVGLQGLTVGAAGLRCYRQALHQRESPDVLTGGSR